MRNSLVLGVGTGVAAGAVIGSRFGSDQTENAIKGAVVGGIVSGVASYFIHGSLKRRDENTRRDTLMNLEHFDVMGVDLRPGTKPSKPKDRDGKCYQTRVVDGRAVSVPCHLLNDGGGL